MVQLKQKPLISAVPSTMSRRKEVLKKRLAVLNEPVMNLGRAKILVGMTSPISLAMEEPRKTGMGRRQKRAVMRITQHSTN